MEYQQSIIRALKKKIPRYAGRRSCYHAYSLAILISYYHAFPGGLELRVTCYGDGESAGISKYSQCWAFFM